MKTKVAHKPTHKPIDGAYRTWSDGRRVHLLVQFTGGHLGRGPVTMHATTDLVPARAEVRRRLETSGDVAGDPVTVEALATRVGAFSAFRRIGRAARNAAALATAPVRALAGAGENVLRTTGNLAKGIESTTALATFATKPLGWRPGRKSSGPPAAASAAAPPAEAEPQPEPESNPSEEEPMADETSGSPTPKADQVQKASGLLRRARFSPKSARHVQNIAKAAAMGHPGAQLAQVAIIEARRRNQKGPAPAAATAAMPLPAHAASPPLVRAPGFPAWSRGAA